MRTPILTVEGLNVDIALPTGTLHAVRDVSFEVNTEQTFAIVGESGCGKTMTALSLMRLLPAAARISARRLRFDGEDLLALGAGAMTNMRGSRIAMIFQDATSALNPVFRVGTQLEDVYLAHRGGRRSGARRRAMSLLERLGISSPALRMRQYPHELSGGMRQRIMIALALMCEPRLVIADEPTTALDVTVQAQILELLLELQRELKLALILIAHDLGVVAQVAQRVAVMYAGEIVEMGAVPEVFGRPAHPYTQSLLACVPRRGRALGAIPGVVPTLIGEIAGCLFRNRCSSAVERCGALEPAYQDMGQGHGYRCHVPMEQRASINAERLER